MQPVTAARLRLTREERKALRAAGLEAADLRHMAALDVVAATEEVIDEERADLLVRLAECVGRGISPNHALTAFDLGVKDAADLANRSPEQLFFAHLDASARTHALGFDLLARSVYLAGIDEPDPKLLPIAAWTKHREDSGYDPLLAYWRHLHGADTQLSRRTRSRLRMPTLGVTAPVFEGGPDPDGALVRPLGQRDVVTAVLGGSRRVVGHWMWRGGHGAFMRLEDLRPGDGVRLGDDWFRITAVDMQEASADLESRGADLLLFTPPHRRAGVIGLPEMLPPVQRGTLQVVARASSASEEETDTVSRPIRRITGAY